MSTDLVIHMPILAKNLDDIKLVKIRDVDSIDLQKSMIKETNQLVDAFVCTFVKKVDTWFQSLFEQEQDRIKSYNSYIISMLALDYDIQFDPDNLVIFLLIDFLEI